MVSARYVVDTSVVIQAFIDDIDTPRAMSLMRRLFETPPDVLIVPEFCVVECTNILWKRVRFEGENPADMQRALDNLTQSPLVLRPVTELLTEALRIGLAHQLAIYDSIYIALARELNCPLITADGRQASAAAKVGVTLKPLTDFPPYQI